jgi:hypothetical protein
VFRFLSTAESTAAAPDTLFDFAQGQDRISFSEMYDAFTFDGPGTLPAAGHISYDYTGFTTRVFADIDGDHSHDLMLQIVGHVALTAADFIL